MKLNKYLKSLYGKRFTAHLILGFMLSFITAATQYAMTQHLGVMIDAVRNRPESILYDFSLVSVFLACHLTGNAAFTLFSGRKAASFACRLQSKIGDKICSARYQAIEQTEDGTVLAIADKDIAGLKNWLMLLWRSGTLPVNLLLIPINLFRWCDWKFTIAVLSLIPLNAMISVRIAKKLPSRHHNEKNAYATVISTFTSTIQFEMIIKAYQLEQIFHKKAKDKLQEHLKKKRQRLLYERFAEVFNRCFGHFSRIFLLLVGAYLILTEDMTIGGLTSIILLAELVGEGLKIIGNIPASLQTARVGAERIRELLTMENEKKQIDEQTVSLTDQASAEIPIYRVQNLSFSYKNYPALQNLSFQIKEGEKIAVVGPSGGGKTTLFKLLSGLYLPAKNHILFRGQDLSGIPLQILREKITAAPQEAFLFQASLKDNITIAKPDANHAEIMEASQKAMIDTFIRSQKDEYNRNPNTTIPSISNGQMQRINLARAFLRNAEVLLLDEPTSALDADTAGIIWDYLFKDCADKTMMVILHDMEEITRFDKILVLNHGEIAGFGSHEDLLLKCELYQQLYRNSGKRNLSALKENKITTKGVFT